MAMTERAGSKAMAFTLIWAPGSRVLAVLSVIKEPGRQINYGTGKDVSDETIPSPPRKVCTFSY